MRNRKETALDDGFCWTEAFLILFPIKHQTCFECCAIAFMCMYFVSHFCLANMPGFFKIFNVILLVFINIWMFLKLWNNQKVMKGPWNIFLYVSCILIIYCGWKNVMATEFIWSKHQKKKSCLWQKAKQLQISLKNQNVIIYREFLEFLKNDEPPKFKYKLERSAVRWRNTKHSMKKNSKNPLFDCFIVSQVVNFKILIQQYCFWCFYVTYGCFSRMFPILIFHFISRYVCQCGEMLSISVIITSML